MSELQTLLGLFQDNNSSSITVFSKIFRFANYASSLRDDILLPQPATHPPSLPPAFLPNVVRGFLANACELPLDHVDQCWSVLKESIWDGELGRLVNPDTTTHFMQHGHPAGLSMSLTYKPILILMQILTIPQVLRSLYPPQHTCLHPDCTRSKKGQALKKAEQRQAVLYTLDSGVLPVWSVHLYCEGASP